MKKKVLRSNSKKAKEIIKEEIKSTYGCDPQNRTYGKDYIRNMKEDADVHSYQYGANDFNKAKQLVKDGNFAVYTSDTDKMLGKIYGKENVKKWTANKKWQTYQNLIAREYVSELRKRNKRKEK